MKMSYFSSLPPSRLFSFEPIENRIDSTLSISKFQNTLYVENLSITPINLSLSPGYHAFEYQHGRILLMVWRQNGELIVYNRLKENLWFTVEEEKNNDKRLLLWNKWKEEQAQHLSFCHFQQEDIIDPMGTQSHNIIFTYGFNEDMKGNQVFFYSIFFTSCFFFSLINFVFYVDNKYDRPSGQARWRNVLFSSNWANGIRSFTAKLIEDNSLTSIYILSKHSPLPSEMDYWNQLLIADYLGGHSMYCERLLDTTLLRIEMGHTTVFKIKKNEDMKPTAYILASFIGNGGGFTVQFSLIHDNMV